MDYCITHGRAHHEGEADSVHTLGDDLRCRLEEWPSVIGGEVLGSQCERSDESSLLVATGSLAYLVSETAGMVPVKVKAVTDPMTPGPEAWEPPVARVVVTAARVGFDRGEVLTLSLPTRTLVNRDQVYRKGGAFRVNGGTRFLTDEGRTW